MKKTLIAFCLMSITGLLLAQEPEEMFTRRYLLDRLPDFSYLPDDGNQGAGGDPFGGNPFGGRSLGGNQPGSKQQEPQLPWARVSAGQEELQNYFSHHLGVEFAEGSWLRFRRFPLSITMRNTRGNHELLQLGLIQVQAFARQVQLDVRFISMPADEVGRWERSFGRSLTDSQILDLWKEGKAETIYAQGVKTMNGVNAIIENVDERIYPTEMDKTRPAREGDNPREEWKQTYGGFETRRVGFILNITPTLSPGSTINLVVLPEQVRDLGDDKTAPEDLQPILRQFRSWNITSSIVIQNGETLAIGNSTSLDGEKRQYLLITATVVDATGSPVHLPDGAEADETE